MKKNSLITIVVIILLGGVVASYLYWQHTQPQPEPSQVEVPPPASPPAPNPIVQQVIDAPPTQPELPKLNDSDKLMLETLAGLLHNEALMLLFYNEQIIHNIVATIDNLPRSRMPVSVMPVKRMHGQFITEGTESNKIISPKNAARYSVYVRIAEVVDTQKLVEAYIHLYPLFQKAYNELGYPKRYFNDHLLSAPDLKGPVKLVWPNVIYLYAAPDLEARSAGQKILMRMGSKNEAKIKDKLREIKQQILLHTREKRVIVANEFGKG